MTVKVIVWLVGSRAVVMWEYRLRFVDRTECGVVSMRVAVESLLGTWWVDMICELLRLMFSVMV